VTRTPIHELGWNTLRFVEDLGRMGRFAGHVARTTFTRAPRLRRLTDEVFDIGVLSLPIVMGSGLAVGMVLGLQGYDTLVRFGAEDSLGAVVGLSLIRELGPVLTGLLVTGRAGSAVAAEIGAMVATEQLDGLRMMSIDPVDLVVKSKAAAMVLAMPLLSAIFIGTALFGGYLVGVGVLGVDGGSYTSSLESSVQFGEDVAGSVVKALVFGALVGLVATYRGYHSRPTSAGVSAATTATVVMASVAILVLDLFITALWKG
jgi:phospholipid/cholesterol/gamma-HCH transport system permease protein